MQTSSFTNLIYTSFADAVFCIRASHVVQHLTTAFERKLEKYFAYKSKPRKSQDPQKTSQEKGRNLKILFTKWT